MVEYTPVFIITNLLIILWEIGSFSYAFKGANIIFRFTESVDIAASSSYQAIVSYYAVMSLTRSIQGGAKSPALYLAIPTGFLCLATLYRPLRWLSRYAIMFIIGTTAGLTMQSALVANFVGNIRTIVATPLTSIDNIIFVVFAITCLVSFMFSINIKGDNRTLNFIMRFGRIAFMFFVGANYASTMQKRFTSIIQVLSYPIWDLLGLRPFTIPT